MNALASALPSARPKTARRRGGLPILQKVLIANASIVVLGAIAGTWITSETARSTEGRTFMALAFTFVVIGIVLSVVVNYVVLRAAFRPLATLEAALAVRQGDLSVRAAPSSFTDPQVAHLAETFNATLDELARDREELRSLASQVIRAQEDERRRIAR